MSSIRGFLITLLLATIVLTIFLSVLQGYQASDKEIQRQMDAKLLDLAKLLSKQHIDGSASAYKIHAGEKFAFQLVPLKEGRSAQSVDDVLQTIAPLQQGFNEVNFNNYRWRSYAFFNEKTHLWVIVAERLDIRFDLAERTLLKSLSPIVFGIPIAALLIWFLVGHALKPLHKLSNALKNKREDDLSPLTIQQPYSEVEQVIQSSNKLLKRLNSSFEREKHFASDVAHELRTPISVLKMDLFNLSQKQGNDGQDIRALNRSVERMERLVQQILTLYRTTPDQFLATFTLLDLTELTQKVIVDHYDIFAQKSQKIEFQGDACYLEGDKSALSVLLVNLIENASKYTHKSGLINVSIMDTTDTVTLEVEDSGVGIPQVQYARVFERFYREDGDCHSSNEQGCGLGLAIVKHIVDLHKAHISLHASRFDTGLMVRVEIPKGKINV